jgi:hypothetical protein
MGPHRFCHAGTPTALANCVRASLAMATSPSARAPGANARQDCRSRLFPCVHLTGQGDCSVPHFFPCHRSSYWAGTDLRESRRAFRRGRETLAPRDALFSPGLNPHGGVGTSPGARIGARASASGGGTCGIRRGCRRVPRRGGASRRHLDGASRERRGTSPRGFFRGGGRLAGDDDRGRRGAVPAS